MLRVRLPSLPLLPRRYAVLLVVGLLAMSWGVVHAAGGTKTALPHLFYLPVIAAVAPFGRRGGMVVGVAATLLCGPAMPLDVAAGIAQAPGNWLTRGFFFVLVGAAAGTAVNTVATGFERSLTRHLQRDLVRVAPAVEDPDEAHDRIRQLLDDQEFTMVFQPVYDLDNGVVVAVEALTRFGDVLPLQSPAKWFEQAAQVGLGTDLEVATAQAALKATRDLPDHVALSLNASPAALDDPRMLALFEGYCHRQLIIEVTEHATVDDYPALLAALSRLRDRGVRIAVDDAGAGFASLQHIVRLSPDIIKVDISLTQNVRDDHVRRALASALVQFAEQTGSRLIAEGIETEADLSTWQHLGAHGAQGYLLGRPTAEPLLAPYWALASSAPSRDTSAADVAQLAN